MGDPAAVTPEGLEILVARDLRKAGLEIGRLRRHRLDAPEDGSGNYDLELVTEIRLPARAPVLVDCHRADSPIGPDAVRALAARMGESAAGPGGGRAPAAGIVVSTAGFSPEALNAAREARIALLRVADARTAFDTSGWGPAGQYPSWLPAHVLELAIRDAAGMPGFEMLGPGSASRLLAAMGLAPR